MTESQLHELLHKFLNTVRNRHPDTKVLTITLPPSDYDAIVAEHEEFSSVPSAIRIKNGNCFLSFYGRSIPVQRGYEVIKGDRKNMTIYCNVPFPYLIPTEDPQ